MDHPPPASPPPPFTEPRRIDPAEATPPVGGWAVAAGRGLAWWSEGWRLFTAAPVIWIAITFIFIALMFGLAFIPFIGQIASTLLYPVLGAGVLLGARALDLGGELTIGHLFACFNHRAMPLIVLALIYFGAWFVIWIIGAGVLVALGGFQAITSLMSGDPVDSAMALLSGIGIAALIAVLVMLLLGIPLIMAYWFAPALVVFRGDEPFAAMKASFTAGMRNIPPFLVYSLIGMLLAFIATIPLGLGWIVLAPVYTATLYVSYKDIFGEPA